MHDHMKTCFTSPMVKIKLYPLYLCSDSGKITSKLFSINKLPKSSHLFEPLEHINLSEEVEGAINIQSTAQCPKALAYLLVKFALVGIRVENVCSHTKHAQSSSASSFTPADVSWCQFSLRLAAQRTPGTKTSLMSGDG